MKRFKSIFLLTFALLLSLFLANNNLLAQNKLNKQKLSFIEKEIKLSQKSGQFRRVAVLLEERDSIIDSYIRKPSLNSYTVIKSERLYRGLEIDNATNSLNSSNNNLEGYEGLVVNRRFKESVSFVVYRAYGSPKMERAGSWTVPSVQQYNSENGTSVTEVIEKERLLPSISGYYHCIFYVGDQFRGTSDFSVPAVNCNYKGKRCFWYLTFGSEDMPY
jgi:hypothetical protein